MSQVMDENVTLTNSEQNVLRAFRAFLMSPGQMLCFSGPKLKQYKNALGHLTDKGLMVEEKFKGGYSLTQAGYEAMKACDKKSA